MSRTCRKRLMEQLVEYLASRHQECWGCVTCGKIVTVQKEDGEPECFAPVAIAERSLEYANNLVTQRTEELRIAKQEEDRETPS